MKKIYKIVFSLVLCLFTGYALLDTFVISRPYSPAASATAADAASAAVKEAVDDSNNTNEESNKAVTQVNSKPDTKSTSVTSNSYSDDNISITLTTDRVNDTTVYVADITLSSPEYLKTALANDTYGKNVTAATSDIADSVNAILAINGDYYGARESGYVIRNGVIYRDTAIEGQQDLVIYENGEFEVITEDEISAEELLAKGAYQVFSFGPGLLSNGEITVSENEEVGRAMASNPRTAIGEIEKNHYVMVVADGRTSESAGLSLYELAEYMQSLGVKCAYNLDGGGSSTMVFNGTVVNNPTTSGRSIGRERKVSDIVYIKA